MSELKKLFRPEFLNRIDETIVFQSLTSEDIAQIIDLMIDDLRQRLIVQGMSIELTEAAKEARRRKGHGHRLWRQAAASRDSTSHRDPLSEEVLEGKWGEVPSSSSTTWATSSCSRRARVRFPSSRRARRLALGKRRPGKFAFLRRRAARKLPTNAKRGSLARPSCLVFNEFCNVPGGLTPWHAIHVAGTCFLYPML